MAAQAAAHRATKADDSGEEGSRYRNIVNHAPPVVAKV
jgi:hypothetical protein